MEKKFLTESIKHSSEIDAGRGGGVKDVLVKHQHGKATRKKKYEA
jgi:hypothetical protein